MKSMMVAALFAAGLGLASVSGASAAPAAAGGVSTAAQNATMIEQTAYACRRVKVCRWVAGIRRCTWNRVCRVW